MSDLERQDHNSEDMTTVTNTTGDRNEESKLEALMYFGLMKPRLIMSWSKSIGN